MKCKHWLCRLIGHPEPVQVWVPTSSPFMPGNAVRPVLVCRRSWAIVSEVLR